MNEATVIIAAWSAERFISKGIESALAQQDVAVKVVVVDDASPDDTAGAVARFPDAVQYVRLLQNGGPSLARNKAIDLSQTEWIAVLDADDTLAPNCLNTLISMAEQTKADIVLGNIVRVDEAGVPITSDADFLGRAQLPEGQALSLEDYLSHNRFHPSSAQIGYLKPLFRKSALDRLDLRYDEALRNSEDFHIVLRAIALGARVVISQAPCYRYTVRAGSISHRVAPEIFQKLLTADQAFEQAFATQLTDGARSLLKNRQIALRDLMESEIVLGCLKSRQFGQAVGHLLRRPRSAPRVIRQLWEALANRL